MIVFEIDNVPYDAPENWETVDTVLKRDRTFDGILASYEATVTSDCREAPPLRLICGR